MAWSLVAMFSINSITSSSVFNMIFPPAKASSNCFEWGRKPSMKVLSWTGSLNPWVGVFQSKPWKRLRASLSDSSGNWWNEEIFTFPLVVFDFGKYFFKNFSTSSSYVRKLFPLNKCNHLFASPAKENENRLRQMASSGTPAIFIVLQISMYVARWAYGSSLGSPWKRLPWINWMRECG